MQARRKQVLLKARSSHLPVHRMLFLKGLSYSHEIKEDHAGSKEHYIGGNMLCSKSLYKGENLNEICLSLFQDAPLN